MPFASFDDTVMHAVVDIIQKPWTIFILKTSRLGDGGVKIVCTVCLYACVSYECVYVHETDLYGSVSKLTGLKN